MNGLITASPFISLGIIAFVVYCVSSIYIKQNVYIERRIVREFRQQFQAILLEPGYRQEYAKRGNSQCRFFLGHVSESIFKNHKIQSHRLVSYLWFKNQDEISDLVKVLREYLGQEFEVVTHKHNPYSLVLKKSGTVILRITLHRVDRWKVRLICNLVSPKYPIISL